jgi:CheY-like chemotaxis protein
MNILIVEDEAPLRKTLLNAFGSEGHHVEGAVNGLEALARCAERIPDLILLDLQMPEMDGWQFQREFRCMRGCSDVPIIVMSATHLALGNIDAQAVFEKPFDLDALLDAGAALLAAGIHHVA